MQRLKTSEKQITALGLRRKIILWNRVKDLSERDRQYRIITSQGWQAAFGLIRQSFASIDKAAAIAQKRFLSTLPCVWRSDGQIELIKACSLVRLACASEDKVTGLDGNVRMRAASVVTVTLRRTDSMTFLTMCQSEFLLHEKVTKVSLVNRA